MNTYDVTHLKAWLTLMHLLDHDDLHPCSVKCTGPCPKMLLYVLNELFHVFWGVGANGLYGQ